MDNTYLNQWLDSIRNKVKTRTYERYEEIVSAHIVPYLDGKNISELTASDWEDYVYELSQSGNKRTGKKLSDNSIVQIIGVVKRLYKYLVKVGYLQTNPVADLSVRSKQKQIEVLSEYEQKRLERDILKRRSLREYGIIIALYTGLRIGELLALEWSDVDLKQRRITVKKTLSPIKVSDGNNPYIGTPKTDCGIRVIPFPKTLVPILSELRKQKNKYVISSRSGGFVMVSSYQKSFGKILARLKLKHMGFHSLRHTFATRAIERGADMKTLSEILGHSSPAITMARYVHSSDKLKYRLMEKVGNTLKLAE